MIQALAVTGLFVGLWLQLLGDTIRVARGSADDCTCRDFAWDPKCPVHGRKEHA